MTVAAGALTAHEYGETNSFLDDGTVGLGTTAVLAIGAVGAVANWHGTRSEAGHLEEYMENIQLQDPPAYDGSTAPMLYGRLDDRL